jgi:hypothetical protein
MRTPRVGATWVCFSRVETTHDVVDVDLYMGGTSRNRSSTE